MDYQEAIDYLYSRLPLFQNLGNRAYKPGLDTTLALCEVLDNPNKKFRSIHVAGTNGKGSSAHMLASVLQAAGFRVGLYTSPHLKSFTERIRVDGLTIPEPNVAAFVTKLKRVIEEFHPSFFEVTVAMAFDHFAHERVDIAIVEVGMGGRLDSTNVITPLLSLITNISFDHSQYLGDTLPLIAAEKAGIIKKNVPVVISELPSDPDVLSVFQTKSAEVGAELTIAAHRYETLEDDHVDGRRHVKLLQTDLNTRHTYHLDLVGDYQAHNVKGVLTVIEILKNDYNFDITDIDIENGLSSVVHSTGLKGRWQILGYRPFIVADTAHNLAGITSTIRQFLRQPAEHYRFVLGFVADKDVTKLMRILPKQGIYYFCQPSVERAMPVGKLSALAHAAGLDGQSFTNVNDAMLQMLTDANQHDAVYVGGSTFVVADIDII